MNLLLGHLEGQRLRVRAFSGSAGWNVASCPVFLLCLLPALLWLPVLHLFALVFGSPTKVEDPVVGLVFFSLTSMSLTLTLFPPFLDILNYKVLLVKKKRPTLSVFWEIGIISI